MAEKPTNDNSTTTPADVVIKAPEMIWVQNNRHIDTPAPSAQDTPPPAQAPAPEPSKD